MKVKMKADMKALSVYHRLALLSTLNSHRRPGGCIIVEFYRSSFLSHYRIG